MIRLSVKNRKGALGMARCLVTGGAGFIGSHLCEALTASGWQVAVMDNLSTGRLSNLGALADGLKFFHADVCDLSALLTASAGVDVIFHLGALVSVPASLENPGLSAKINDLGTLNVFEAARRNRVAKVVFSSSAAVYGNSALPPHHEEQRPEPLSPYAAHKLIGEYYGRIYASQFGVGAVSLRYFNVYGPRQDPRSPYSGVISIFADHLFKGTAPTIFGDGEQTRDFIYVGDVVRANLLAASGSSADGLAVNIGSGSTISIAGLWEEMAKIKGTALKANFEAERPGDVRHSSASVEKAGSVLGFKAKVGLAEGLRETLGWFANDGR